MEDSIQTTITEQYTAERYDPSEEKKDVIEAVLDKFRASRDDRNRSFEYFDNRNLIDYINDSVERTFTNLFERDYVEDWQAQGFSPLTRNKVIAVLGKIASMMPVGEIVPVGDEDFRRAQILSDLVSHADRVDDSDELMFFGLFEGISKGTAVLYQGYEEKKRKIRDIKNYNDGTDLKLVEGERITRKLRGSVVPLEDFYPSSVRIRKIKDMPYCFWRSEMKLSEFAMKFSQYDEAKKVEPYSASFSEDDRPFYADHLGTDVEEGNVEIIRYYNQDVDEFIILANGVWLNPLPGDIVMPIPFLHKTLPFCSFIYEPLGADFFYGKSLPDKLKTSQDTFNILYNMMLDQSFLSIFMPILVDGMDDIQDDFLRPGRRIPVSDPSKYRELKISSPDGFHQFILEYTKRTLEESSIDQVAQGNVSNLADRTPAAAVNAASKAVSDMLGLFNQFIKWGRRDMVRLQAKNVLQFYTRPMIEGVLGSGSMNEFNKAFNTFTIDNTALTNGKRGTKIIDMYNSRDDMPTAQTLQFQAMMAEKEMGRNVEKVAISKDYIRDFEFDVILTANQNAEESKALQKAQFIEFANFALQGFPEMVDKETLFTEATALFGFRPDKFMRKQEPQNEMLQQQQNMGLDTSLSRNMMVSAAGKMPQQQ